MRHLRIIGLCLAAVFAIAAVTASTASAKKPEWGKCVAQAGGKYLDGACQTKGKGGCFEWKKGATLPNVPFTGDNEAAVGSCARPEAPANPAYRRTGSRRRSVKQKATNGTKAE